VLIDAPCSGTGTIGRRPDLVTRWRASNLEELRGLQTKILVTTSERARPGGAIVYAVCSVLREEGEDVVARALESAPWLSTAPFPAGPARRLAAEAHPRLTPPLEPTAISWRTAASRLTLQLT
jgi:16S rRNA (cytosine967-C5)-methyltransferase